MQNMTPFEKVAIRSFNFAQNLANSAAADAMCEAIMLVDSMPGKKGKKARKDGILILTAFAIDE